MAIVVFDPALFRQQRPQFANPDKYSDVFLQNCFDEAALICSNTESSMVPYNPDKGINDRQILLYLLTCHIATLATSGQVGSITSATEAKCVHKIISPFSQFNCLQDIFMKLVHFLRD